MSKEKVIGIDLASSQSVVAGIENGKPEVIINAEGQRTTPSVVMIKGGERKIGAPAKRQAIMNPKNTITYIKRFMGNEFTDPDVQHMIKMVTYDVVDKNNLPRVAIDGTLYSPEEISSYILGYMKKQAENYYGCDVKKAVITCPAWYNDSQRNAVKVAGELAGLEVMRIINEPTAGILAAGLKPAAGKEMLVLVSDIGGATSDFSLCEISDVEGQTMVEVLASNGDVFLGGQNYDNAIVNWLADEFAKDHSGVDLRKDKMAYSRLIEAAEKAKCELSSSASAEINLPYITVVDNVPQMLVTTLTRAKFEQLTSDLTNKVVDCAKKCLEKAGKNASDLDEILLVGGSTRMLSIQEGLTKAFNVKLDKSVNPDEAVALGAAIQADVLNGGDSANNVLLLDVTPLSLGIKTEGDVMTKLIEANTTIPTAKSQVFSTAVDNQTTVSIEVLQGERPMAADNKLIGTFNLDGIMPARRGVPQIEVTFDIDANGILTVSAKDKASGKQQKITIDNSKSLSKEEIEKIKADAEKFRAEDEKKTEEIKKINEAESYQYAVENSLNDENLSKVISDEDKKNVNEKIDVLKDKIKSKDLNAVEQAKKDLEQVFAPIAQKLYQNQQQSHQPTQETASAASSNDSSNSNDDIQDADFDEVK